MGPNLKALELFRCSRYYKLLRILLFTRLLINFDQALGDDGSCVGYASKLSPEKVALFARERGLRLDLGIQVACEYVLDELGSLDVLRLHVWELYPVLQDIISHPVY
jgi:hypothetical protein